MRNIRLQYAAWADLPADFQSLFIHWLGDDPARGQAFYELYFYWFNIAHEVAHVLREQYGATDRHHWRDEVAVNTFAVAYWGARGESERLRQLSESIGLLLSQLQDPTPSGAIPADYFDQYYSELAQDPPAFGYYHFSMVSAALAQPLSWPEALRTLITPDIVEAAPLAAEPYPAISVDLPPRIVRDLRADVKPYGLHLPEIQITCAFAPELQFVVWDD